MTSEEWKALQALAGDRSSAIRQADKGSCAVVWGNEDYIKEAEKQFQDRSVYKDFKGCIRYIFASLFFKSKREHLSN